MALVDCFLKITGVEGESKDDKHPKEIEIDSFSFGVAQAGTGGLTGGGQGAGKAHFHDMSFTSKISKASPKLKLGCVTGQHIDEATLVCRKAGGQQEEYLKIKLNGVLISSYNVSGVGSGGAVPTDQFTLNFTKIEFTYQEQSDKGSVGSPVKVGYDVAANKKL
jgi:type VI secretion system secreted protein Hcp